MKRSSVFFAARNFSMFHGLIVSLSYFRAISKVLGEQWRELSNIERQEYATKAKVMADERRKINPDCWKRKRKKSKDAEHEIDVDKLKMKAKKSPA